jgi:hypothetical protein
MLDGLTAVGERRACPWPNHFGYSSITLDNPPSAVISTRSGSWFVGFYV